METELRLFEKGSHANMHPDGLEATLKKIANWKTLRLDVIHGFWFKYCSPIHDRLATETNKCIQKTKIPQWMTKGRPL